MPRGSRQDAHFALPEVLLAALPGRRVEVPEELACQFRQQFYARSASLSSGSATESAQGDAPSVSITAADSNARASSTRQQSSTVGLDFPGFRSAGRTAWKSFH